MKCCVLPHTDWLTAHINVLKVSVLQIEFYTEKQANIEIYQGFYTKKSDLSNQISGLGTN